MWLYNKVFQPDGSLTQYVHMEWVLFQRHFSRIFFKFRGEGGGVYFHKEQGQTSDSEHSASLNHLAKKTKLQQPVGSSYVYSVPSFLFPYLMSESLKVCEIRIFFPFIFNYLTIIKPL